MTNIHQTKFKIAQMRQDKLILGVESISVFILALFVSAFLPQLLFQFYYANQQLTAEPVAVTYIPVTSFVIAILFFIYAMVTSIMKKMKISQLEKELDMMMLDDCCGGGCGCDHGSMHHMESDMMMEETMPAAKPKKTTTRKKTK